MAPTSSLDRQDTRFQHAVGAIDTLVIRWGGTELGDPVRCVAGVDLATLKGTGRAGAQRKSRGSRE